MVRYEHSSLSLTRIPVPRAVLIAMFALTLGTLSSFHPVTAEAAVIGVDVDVAPPAPRVEAVPAPRAGFVWAPGYWHWNGHAHVWHRGYWVRERPGYHWVGATWVARGPHYHYIRGHWER